MQITIGRKQAIVGGLLAAALGLAACTSTGTSKNDAQASGQAQTQQAYADQSSAVPYPASQLTTSLERQNLKERLLRYNNPSKISYIYLLSQTGSVIGYYTVKGKVTSNSSQMTTDNLIETKCHSYAGDHSCNDVVVDAPGDDGSYGPNEPGIFFFTPEGVMVTWDGPYLMADAPMKINPATLTVEYPTNSKPTSTGGK